jgi:hypothetical protein
VNLASYRTRIMARIGVPAGDGFFTAPILNDVVNQALQTIEEESYWPWSEVLTTVPLLAGTSGLVLPEDWRAVKAVYIDNNELAQCSITDLLRWPATTQGMPSQWAQSGEGIELAPVAAGDYQVVLVYYRMQPPLVSDTDQPMLPDRFHPAVVAKGAELCARREDDGPNQAVHLADYTQWLNRMKKAMRSTTRPTVPRVRPGSWLDGWT